MKPTGPLVQLERGYILIRFRHLKLTFMCKYGPIVSEREKF